MPSPPTLRSVANRAISDTYRGLHPVLFEAGRRYRLDECLTLVRSQSKKAAVDVRAAQMHEVAAAAWVIGLHEWLRPGKGPSKLKWTPGRSEDGSADQPTVKSFLKLIGAPDLTAKACIELTLAAERKLLGWKPEKLLDQTWVMSDAALGDRLAGAWTSFGNLIEVSVPVFESYELHAPVYDGVRESDEAGLEWYELLVEVETLRALAKQVRGLLPQSSTLPEQNLPLHARWAVRAARVLDNFEGLVGPSLDLQRGARGRRYTLRLGRLLGSMQVAPDRVLAISKRIAELGTVLTHYNDAQQFAGGVTHWKTAEWFSSVLDPKRESAVAKMLRNAAKRGEFGAPGAGARKEGKRPWEYNVGVVAHSPTFESFRAKLERALSDGAAHRMRKPRAAGGWSRTRAGTEPAAPVTRPKST